MDERTAEQLAAIVGGEAWQSGGGQRTKRLPRVFASAANGSRFSGPRSYNRIVTGSIGLPSSNRR